MSICAAVNTERLQPHSWLGQHTGVSVRAGAKQTTPINLAPLDAPQREVTQATSCVSKVLCRFLALLPTRQIKLDASLEEQNDQCQIKEGSDLKDEPAGFPVSPVNAQDSGALRCSSSEPDSSILDEFYLSTVNHLGKASVFPSVGCNTCGRV
ncbi:hypothetical protein EYF80_012869 [Liparis tanakae]|uniref:Uncharacterized protein n=1 Tax=Liparis tanakae TaxID=230148 RepID=A0A4Z2IFR8_9TELE|nr:hypothetical protein EYF80_012869 [Liparis tanakae]